MKALGMKLFILGFTLSAMFIAPETLNAAAKTESYGYKLAVINDRKTHKEDDTEVKMFNILIDQISSRCTSSKQIIYDLLVSSHNDLLKEGVDLSMQELVEEAQATTFRYYNNHNKKPDFDYIIHGIIFMETKRQNY